LHFLNDDKHGCYTFVFHHGQLLNNGLTTFLLLLCLFIIFCNVDDVTVDESLEKIFEEITMKKIIFSSSTIAGCIIFTVVIQHREPIAALLDVVTVSGKGTGSV